MNYLIKREELEKQEEKNLGPYAAWSSRSRGRRFKEAEHVYRTCYQRDRDRVIHSAAFRRLKHKTQVFASPNDDHFRTRLTHTMEVAQISRTIARTLRLNEDLAETIALVHDLGHTPFGHAGEEAMDALFADDGGYNHNAQSLRVVDVIEDRYPDFRGLNLTYEVREGIVKHETDYDMPVGSDFDAGKRPSLESQLVNYADEIAYNAHDLDDGIFSDILNPEQIGNVPIVRQLLDAIRSEVAHLSSRKRHYFLIRQLINWAVTDLVENTARRMAEMQIETYDDVTNCPENIVRFSANAAEANKQLKSFLFESLYRHPRLQEVNELAKRIVRDLFEAYMNDTSLLTEKFKRRLGEEPKKLVVRDYIAGMTDRFALNEHYRIIGTISPEAIPSKV